MPFRPLSNPERADLLARIEGAGKAVQLRQGYLTILREELEKGVWFSDMDYSKLPLPTPDCYICAEHITLPDRCGVGGDYGVVCAKYLHFTGRVAKQ